METGLLGSRPNQVCASSHFIVLRAIENKGHSRVKLSRIEVSGTRTLVLLGQLCSQTTLVAIMLH